MSSRSYINIGDLPDNARAKCDNCGRITPVTNLAAVEDLAQRVTPGAEFPAGQCPSFRCGGLAYVVAVGDFRGAAESYAQLHDGLSDMIEAGRLIEADCPDDYRWLVESLAYLAAFGANDDRTLSMAINWRLDSFRRALGKSHALYRWLESVASRPDDGGDLRRVVDAADLWLNELREYVAPCGLNSAEDSNAYEKQANELQAALDRFQVDPVGGNPKGRGDNRGVGIPEGGSSSASKPDCGLCPSCGSKSISGDLVIPDNRRAFQSLSCGGCGESWTDAFRLDGRIGDSGAVYWSAPAFADHKLVCPDCDGDELAAGEFVKACVCGAELVAVGNV